MERDQARGTTENESLEIQKRPFSDTVEFVKLRIAEARIEEELPRELKPGIEYPLLHLDLPEFDKDLVEDANTRLIIGLYCGTNLSFNDIGKVTRFRSRERKEPENQPEVKYYYHRKSDKLLHVKVQNRETTRRAFRRGVQLLHETASEALQQKFPIGELSLFKPRNYYEKDEGWHRNKLGEFLYSIKTKRNISLKEIGNQLNLKSIHNIGRKNPLEISLYSLTQIMENFESLSNNLEEKEQLADIVVEIIQLQLQEKGKLYERIPPIVFRTVGNELECSVDTPTQLARKAAGDNPAGLDEHQLYWRIESIRRRNNYPVLLTDKQSNQILNKIYEERKSIQERRQIESSLGNSLVQNFGVDAEFFARKYWTTRPNGIPNEEEFGQMLENLELPEDKREELIDMWIQAFRVQLPLANERYLNEFKITRQALHQYTTTLKLDSTLSNWEKIERIREHRQSYKKGGPRKGRSPSKEGTLASLAREFNVTQQAILYWAKRLEIQDRKNLTSEDIDRLKRYGETSPKKTIKMGTISALASELNIPRTTLNVWALRIGIGDTKHLTPDDIDRLRRYSETRLKK